MVITAISTRQPPQAPSTPVVAQQALSELVQYYRELAAYHRSSADYHRQLLEQHSQDAEVVEKQLASIEAILHPLTTSSVNQDANGKQVNRTGQITSLEDTVSEEDKDIPVASEEITVEPEESKVKEITTDDKKPETKASKSVTQGSRKNSVQTKSGSSKATKAKKPTKKKNTNKTKKSTKAFSSRLPYSEKLASCETIVDAVALCLQEYYPKVINTQDLVNYYYPEGLEGETKKKAYEAFSNSLSKGAGKQGWVRSSIGKYRWKEGS
ncbi:MAG: hypothetical protein QNJ72_35330 [Pleurocapsa sp. MO_226.B13]|nr:hypothetical protein [Pleurocapsa sp. MO_226.B13]